MSLSAFEDLGLAIGYGQPKKLADFFAKFAGIPGYVQARRTLRGAKRVFETKDARTAIWSEKAIGDVSVEASMQKRLESPQGWQDRVIFLRWYGKQSAKERAEFRRKYNRDVEAPEGSRAADEIDKMVKYVNEKVDDFDKRIERAEKDLTGKPLQEKLEQLRQEKQQFLTEKSGAGL